MSLEDVRVLLCPDRQIERLSGVLSLTKLEEFDLSDNRLVDPWRLALLPTLKRLDLSGNRSLLRATLASILEANRGFTHLGLRDIFVGDLSRLNLIHPETGEPLPLQELDLTNTGIRDLELLAPFLDLQVLKVAHNHISDIAPIAHLERMRAIDLSHNRVRGFYPLPAWKLLEFRVAGNPTLELEDVNLILSANPTMRRLDLEGIFIEDIGALALYDENGEPYRLRELGLARTSISDLQPLEVFTSLDSLNVSANFIEDEWPVAGLPSLTEIDLSDNRLDYVSGLLGHTGLTALDVSGNPSVHQRDLLEVIRRNPGLRRLGLRDIPLDDPWSLPLYDPSTGEYYPLVELDLRNTGLQMIDMLSGLRELRVLDVSQNQLTAIYILEYLPELREIDVSDNKLSSPFELSLARNLTSIDIGGNPRIDPRDALGVLGLFALKHAGLRGFDIESLDEFFFYPISTNTFYDGLVSLDLEDTGVRDIGQLQEFPVLEKLRLGGNRVSDLQPLAGLERLAELDLSENRLDDVSALSGLMQLRELRLGGNIDLELDEDLRNILLNNESLAVLSLADIPIGDIREIPLQSFDYDYRPYVALDLSRTGLTNVDDLVEITSLQELNLSSNDLRGRPRARASEVTRCERQRVFRCRHAGIRDGTHASGHIRNQADILVPAQRRPRSEPAFGATGPSRASDSTARELDSLRLGDLESLSARGAGRQRHSDYDAIVFAGVLQPEEALRSGQHARRVRFRYLRSVASRAAESPQHRLAWILHGSGAPFIAFAPRSVR